MTRPICRRLLALLWGALVLATPATAEEVRALVFLPADAEDGLALRRGLTVERRLADSAVVRAEPQALAALAAEGARVDLLPEPQRLLLRSGEIDLRDHPLELSAEAAAGEPVPVLVALDGPPPAQWIARLEAAGAQVVGPVPPSGFLLRAGAPALAALAALPEVVALAPFRGDWKVSERALSATVADGEVEVEVATFAGAGGERLEALVARRGSVSASYELAGRRVVRAVVPAAAVAAIAELPEVEWIDRAPRGATFNEKIRVVMQTDRAHFQANQAFYNPVYAIGVFGASQTVAVTDSDFATGHEVYLAPAKVVSHSVPAGSCGILGDGDDHGTLVSATFAGDKAASFGFGTANHYDGLSLASKLILQDIGDGTPGVVCPPANQPQGLFAPAFAAGARVHNNSWGSNVDQFTPQTGSYSLISQALDQHLKAAAFRDSVLVFAAGNFGANWWTLAYVPRSLSDEAHAKNVITAGGNRNGAGKEVMYRFSSRGPTNDCASPPCGNPGRVKPDVVAPSALVTSASPPPPSSYQPNLFGTSFGAPAVSAAAALVRDYFVQGFYPNDSTDPPLPLPPSSALVKAMLVNSTVFLPDSSAYLGNAGAGLAPNAYPNYDQGFGRPVLDQVLEPAGYRELKVYENSTTKVTQGQLWQRNIAFREIWRANCNVLRFTLAWTDAPMTLGAGKALVNDLDLEVVFDGTTYRGNHLHTGGQVYDALNNVEDVYVSLGQMWPAAQPTGQSRILVMPAPAPQVLVQATLRVYGRTVLTAAAQPFAVVATYGTCFDNIPCPPPPVAGGCYRGPGDVVPGIHPPPPPGCDDQTYELGELDPFEPPFPHCEPPSSGGPVETEPIPVEP